MVSTDIPNNLSVEYLLNKDLEKKKTWCHLFQQFVNNGYFKAKEYICTIKFKNINLKTVIQFFNDWMCKPTKALLKKSWSTFASNLCADMNPFAQIIMHVEKYYTEINKYKSTHTNTHTHWHTHKHTNTPTYAYTYET